MTVKTDDGSYPGHLSKVCVHVLVTDWNHLSDALIVTVERTHTHTHSQTSDPYDTV